ncbi:MAG: NUDIX hydrolase [Clostridia bacterium]|nr:NUDIX hydrolase [Clostridia bacterium]
MSEPVNEKGQTLSEFLAEYDMTKYDRPSVTVDNIVLAENDGRLSVLMIKRRNHPFIGCWAFPGGFLEMDEDLEEGASRELYEETGVTGVIPVQLGAYGRPDRDPRGRIITVAFVSRLPEGAVPKAADDAKDADMFAIEADIDARVIRLAGEITGERLTVPYEFSCGKARFIPAENVAGDHSQILADALKMLGII